MVCHVFDNLAINSFCQIYHLLTQKKGGIIRKVSTENCINRKKMYQEIYRTPS